MTEEAKAVLWIGMFVGVTIGTIITQVIEAFRRYRNTSVRIEVPGVQSGSRVAAEAPSAAAASALIDEAMSATDRDVSGRRRGRVRWPAPPPPPPSPPPVEVDWNPMPEGHGGPGRS